MRLCLVSSILALIVLIQAESRSEWLLVLLLASLLLAAYFWLQISPHRQVSTPFKRPTRQAPLANIRLCLVVVVSIGLSAVYGYSWLGSRIDSRLPASESGQVISAVGDVVQCDYSNPSIEKYVVNLVGISTESGSSGSLQRLRKVSLLSLIHI